VPATNGVSEPTSDARAATAVDDAASAPPGAESGDELDEAPRAPRTPQEALFLAIETGDTAKLRALLRDTRTRPQINLEATDEFERTPLARAAAFGNYEALSLLLDEYRCRVDSLDANYGTPLIAAAAVGDARCVRKLLDAGARVNAEDKFGCTPLMYAAAHGRTRALLELLSAGARVNHKDKAGYTALMRATQMGRRNGISRQPAIAMLLAYGSHPATKPEEGEAAASGHAHPQPIAAK
jgi:hypothetical protein